MTVSQGNVGDICAPDTFAKLDIGPSEKIGILLVPFSRSAQAGLRIDWLDSDDSHQSPDAITLQLVTK